MVPPGKYQPRGHSGPQPPTYALEPLTSPPRQAQTPSPASMFWPRALTPPNKPLRGHCLGLSCSRRGLCCRRCQETQCCTALALFWRCCPSAPRAPLSASPRPGCPHPMPTPCPLHDHCTPVQSGGVRCIPGPLSPPGSHRVEEPVLRVCSGAAPHKRQQCPPLHHQGACPVRGTQAQHPDILCPPTSLPGKRPLPVPELGASHLACDKMIPSPGD